MGDEEDEEEAEDEGAEVEAGESKKPLGKRLDKAILVASSNL